MTIRIEWADETWNPMTGCTPVSEACEHCYAERMARRFKPCATCEENWRVECDVCDPEYYFAPIFHPDRLDKPLHWKKPRRIFVNSMSDLFHEAFSDSDIAAVFGVMDHCPQHTFMVLTKRPDRMRRWFNAMAEHSTLGFCYGAAARYTGELYGREHHAEQWPLPNVWLGTTIERGSYRGRLTDLRLTPAAVRFVSYEPALGPFGAVPPWIDWLICGGETDPGARPMQPEWALDVYRQCKAAGVPFFFKRGSKGVEYDHEMTATREVPRAV